MLAAAAIAILTAKCLTCHGAETKASGLDLSTRAGLLAGGSTGPAVVPGDPAASRLYKNIVAKKMPPGRPLEPEEIEAVRVWIEQGAVYGDTPKLSAKVRPRAGLDWWALQSPKSPAVPPGAANPIDAFVLARLREKNLTLNPKADRRTLIRRLYFDLTGLPPKSSDLNISYGEAIEKLLASPQYGERWGRYWLDVVRFGESDGGEHNIERMTAYKYRDYVIDAFNSDKPYNQFIREQLAGDAINPADPKLVAATGFLVAGPFDSVTKQINRDELMRKTSRQDELDDFLTAAFPTFAALTVNCARCHDHKFDPIPQKDYYRITAAFRGITYGEREVYSDQQKKDRDALAAPLRKKLSAINAQLGKLESETRNTLLRAKYEAMQSQKTGKRIPINAIYNHNIFAPVSARHFRFLITAQQGKGGLKVDKFELLPGSQAATDWKAPKPATDDAPQALEFHLEKPMEVSAIRWSGTPRVYRFEVSEDGTNWRTIASSLDHDVLAEVDLPVLEESELAAALPPDSIEPRKKLLAEKAEVQSEFNRIPPLETIHAAKLEPEMLPAHLLDRGSVSKPLEEVTPGALTAVQQLSPDLATGTDAERRLSLAAWFTDPRNPLTARVIVNRVWYQHFGTGIVNTPSDFGFNGDRPSHPELLDWLATEFMANGWSIKWLQRQILSSETYQQSSAMNPAAHAVDAANRLLWHMPLKRMDAETLRDSMLSASGTLNVERAGPSFILQKKQLKGSYLYLAQDENDPRFWRRSVYKFVARGGERIFMDSFDCPDPAVATPQRSVSNTPVQALTLLNNNFILKQSELLAARLDKKDPVAHAYDLLYQRKPTQHERDLARPFIESNGLALYCRALLNSNEFVYVP